MDERAAFLRAICEAPEDDVPRLVFADWLEENGDADRATFIRLQIERARRDDRLSVRPPDSVGGYGNLSRDELTAQIQSLLEQHETSWRAEFPNLDAFTVTFERGLIESIHVRVPGSLPALSHLIPLRSIIPCRTLHLQNLEELTIVTLEQLRSTGILEHLHRLEIGPDTYLNADGVRWLCDHLPSNIRQLMLRYCAVPMQSDIEMLARSRLGQQLERLGLTGLLLDDQDIIALMQQTLPNLIELDLTDNQLDDAGLQVIGQSPGLPKLRSLRIGNNLFGEPGVAALIDSPLFGQLASLDLSDNEGVDEESARILLSAPKISSIRRLDVHATAIPIRLRNQITAKYQPVEAVESTPIHESPIESPTIDDNEVPPDLLAKRIPHRTITLNWEKLFWGGFVLIMVIGIATTTFSDFGVVDGHLMNAVIAGGVAIGASTVLLAVQRWFVRDRFGRWRVPVAIGLATGVAALATGIVGGSWPWLLVAILLSTAIELLLATLYTVLAVRFLIPWYRELSWYFFQLGFSVGLVALALAAAAPRDQMLEVAVVGGLIWMVLRFWMMGLRHHSLNELLSEHHSMFGMNARNSRFVHVTMNSTACAAFLTIRYLSIFRNQWDMHYEGFIAAVIMCSLTSAVCAVIVWGNPAPLARRLSTVGAAFARRSRAMLLPLLATIILSLLAVWLAR